MPTREELRKDLYQKLGGDIKLPIKNRGKVSLQQLGNKGYPIFKALYFQTTERNPKYPQSSGTKDLYKIYKAIYDDTKLTEKDFFRIYACDLKYCKDSDYCKVEIKDPTEYVGKYEAYDIKNEEKMEFYADTEVAKRFTENGESLFLEIMSKYQYFELRPYDKLEDTFDVYELINNDKLSPVSGGKITFRRDENDVVIAYDLKTTLSNLQTLKLDGSKVGIEDSEDETTDDETTDDETTDDETPTPPKPTPTPPKPSPEPPKPSPTPSKYTNYKDVGNLPWKEGDQNEVIEKLNNYFLGKKNDPTLTKDLISALRPGYVGPDGKVYIKHIDAMKTDPELNKILKGVLQENLIKKHIKESTTKVLKDIYKRS